MKIRIKDNSVRFRLTQTEVQKLSEKGSVKAYTDFGESRFSYKVLLKEDKGNLEASFSNGEVVLAVPQKWGTKWHKNDVVGLDHTQKLANGQELYLLLEKDFTCLDNTMEDQSDNYPNPKLQST